MDRDAAVARIKRGLGFYSGTSRDDAIVSALQEAQRELEKGKTLPRFLLMEDQTLSLAAGDSEVALPIGFLRVYEDERIRFLPTNSTIPKFLSRRLYPDAVLAYERHESGAITVTSGEPEVYVLRQATIDFIRPANAAYSFTWSYYKKADVLSSNVENAWLANEPEWLIGEAGARVAADLRDGDAIALFTQIRDRARSSYLSEIVAGEENDGMFQMGANQ